MPDGITALAVLADGRVVSASYGGTLRVWDPAGGDPLATLGGHAGGVTALAVLADGRVVSASYDRTLPVWDPAGGRRFAVFTLDAPLLAVAVTTTEVVIAGETVLGGSFLRPRRGAAELAITRPYQDLSALVDGDLAS